MSLPIVTAATPLAATLAGQGISGLAAGVKSTTDKVKAAGEDFEAMLTSELLKDMRQSLEPGVLFGRDGGDAFGGLFDFFMGKHLAQAGGLGLSAYVQRQLQAGPPK
jgi:flagellar protein FlgJ